MSTEIKSMAGFLRLRSNSNGSVQVATRSENAEYGDTVPRSVDRAQFLAAVAAECGVVIIDRADLPEVRRHGSQGVDFRVEGSGSISGIYSDEDTAAGARGNALAWFAIAEYLDAHPPVNEADLQTLAQMIANVPLDNDLPWTVARALLTSGRIEVKK